ncbi:MAG: glycoside hydrolase family 65 protein [Rikenellaceae bacterium]
MKKSLIIILAAISFSLSAVAKNNSTWEIVAKEKVSKFYPATVANGMIGILPSQKPLQIDKVMLNGVYDVYGRGDGVSNIVQGIDFLSMDLIADGTYLSRSKEQDITSWSQRVDMKHAEIVTEFTWKGKLKIEHRVSALRHLPYNGMATLKVEALSDAKFTFCKSFKGSGSATLSQTTFQTIGANKIALYSAKGESPTGKHTIAASNCFIVEGDKIPDFRYLDNKYSSSVNLDVEVGKGETFEIAVVGAICSTAQFDDPVNEANRLALFGYFDGTELLRQKHYAQWGELWQSDIIIEGNDQDQRNVRFALYNLYSFARKETAYSIGPMGLSGVGYNGHIFWDCEIWMYPPLLMMQPEIAHSLLEYRLERVGAAKQNAFNHGYDGAMFPWESAESGSEETPINALTGPLEHHVTADIAIAFWNYYLVTKDLEWLEAKGYQLIKEVADFWVSRVEKNDKGEYEIKRVVGADEFAINVDNNAFTNASAVIALEAAVKAAQELGLEPNSSWGEVAANIPLRYMADGTVMLYEGYQGATIKQADVNLLSYPLGVITDEKTVRQNLDYYSQKVYTNTPAMTHSIYSIICSELGDSQRAYEYFIEAHHPNLREPFGVISESRSSGNPYFATGGGGLLQAVINGFGGLRITENGVEKVFNATLPASWKKLTIKGIGPNKETFVIK